MPAGTCDLMWPPAEGPLTIREVGLGTAVADEPIFRALTDDRLRQEGRSLTPVSRGAQGDEDGPAGCGDRERLQERGAGPKKSRRPRSPVGAGEDRDDGGQQEGHQKHEGTDDQELDHGKPPVIRVVTGCAETVVVTGVDLDFVAGKTRGSSGRQLVMRRSISVVQTSQRGRDAASKVLLGCANAEVPAPWSTVRARIGLNR
ncbi:hypothetical protein AB0J25_23420 [Streptomyces sp. NPDC049910]|uniref:hypothetical protein n=1 Tax=Streptomyces sp. NPDC049910 TaxID=3155278 RepID=UPI00342E59F3